MTARHERRDILLGLAGLALTGSIPARGQDMTQSGSIEISGAQWSYLADTVMGGVSEGRMTRETSEGEDVLRLTGTVSTENRGGFIQMRTTLDAPLPRDAKGLSLRVRGNGERYFVHLRTGATILPWQYYQAPFETGSDWRQVRIPFSDFRPSGRLLPSTVAPGSVRSIGVVAYGRDHEADVSLAALATY